MYQYFQKNHKKHPQNKWPGWTQDLLIGLVLVFLTLSLYWPVKEYDFLNYDDNEYVSANHYIQNGLTLESLYWAFTTSHVGNWHPMTWISHMLDIQLFGMNSGPHHIINVVFHVLNTLLIFLVFKRMTGKSWQSACVAGLFSLHPLHVETVAWVAERKDVLSTFFWMMSIWAYVKYVERSGILRYLVVLLFFSLGLLSKSMLVTLPFTLLLLDYWPLKRFQSHQALTNTLILEKVPLLILSAASCLITYFVQQSWGAVGTLEIYPIPSRAANALISYAVYVLKMIWPSHLSVLYLYPDMFHWWHVLGALFLIITVTFTAFVTMKRHPYYITGWLWYLGTLVPVIGLIQVGIQARADRYTYVPLIGLFIVIVWGASTILSRWRYKKPVLTITAATVLITFMVVSRAQIRYWKNSCTVFEHALSMDSNNYIAHKLLGSAEASQGMLSEALENFEEALRLKPNNADIYNCLGVSFATNGRIDESVQFFIMAIRLNPRHVQAYNNLGTAMMYQGEYQKAIACYQEALRINPRISSSRINLKKALAQKKQLDK